MPCSIVASRRTTIIPNDTIAEDRSVLAAYTTKTVDFRYRGIDFRFALSHGLFSSADIDAGSRFLLKTISAYLDESAKKGDALPNTVLDAGSGVGVLGIALGRSLIAAGKTGVRVRAQDRDELARVFSARNAEANGLGPETFDAYAEKMLDGPDGARYDLILSNLPAKAGLPVLADFFRRSSRMLTAEGRTAVVIVNTLADPARDWLRAAAAPVVSEETGSEHTVFISGPAENTGAEEAEPDAYFRSESVHELENVPYSIRALHGVADFSEPSRAVVVAAKLALKLGGFGRVLSHESEQGHFPAFLSAAARNEGGKLSNIVLSGRNVLALEAARKNCLAADARVAVETVPAADLGLAADRIRSRFGTFDLVAAFPDIVPRTDRFPDLWTGAAKLLVPGGRFLVSVESSDAARFDRLKPRGFAREGDLKRDGFRALAYLRI